MVCAPPLASLLTSGLVTGVAVLAATAATVVTAIAWAGWRLAREDAAALEAARGPEGRAGIRA
jgi:hypothetical protein